MSARRENIHRQILILEDALKKHQELGDIDAAEECARQLSELRVQFNESVDAGGTKEKLLKG